MSTIGLPNIGLSCYINAVLQSFFYIEEFRLFILKTDFHEKDSFAFYFQCVFKILSNASTENKSGEILEVNLQIFRSYCDRFCECKQGDANHFITYILNKLNIEIANNFPINYDHPNDDNHNRNIISELFRGEQEDRIICEKCSLTENRKTKQNFFTLPLMASQYKDCTIDELMMTFFSMSSIIDMKCNDCHKEMLKHTVVTKWPKYLLINIGRGYVNNEGKMVKINNNVFVNDLTMKVSDNAHIYSKNSERCSNLEYKLLATINHFGDAYNGHYTCNCMTDFSWLEFNDLKVHAIELSEVISRNNNILFFKKTDHTIWTM